MLWIGIVVALLLIGGAGWWCATLLRADVVPASDPTGPGGAGGKPATPGSSTDAPEITSET